MTDNTKFKEDGAQLLEMLIQFRRKYIHHSPVHSCPFKISEGIVRAMLRIARTNEENNQQDKIDSML